VLPGYTRYSSVTCATALLAMTHGASAEQLGAVIEIRLTPKGLFQFLPRRGERAGAGPGPAAGAEPQPSPSGESYAPP